jgi:hypothetical protein
MWRDLFFLDAGHHILWLLKRQFIASCDQRRRLLAGGVLFHVTQSAHLKGADGGSDVLEATFSGFLGGGDIIR